MAERRMFAKSIVLSDAFLDMPMSARCLYFTLGMLADDDGFIGNPKSIMRQCGASQDDMVILLQKRYVLSFESGVIVIKHWRMNNFLRNDRYKETTYLEEKATLAIDQKGSYTENNKFGIPGGNQVVYPGKDSIGNNIYVSPEVDTIENSVKNDVKNHVEEELKHNFEIIYNIYPRKGTKSSAFESYKKWVQKSGRKVGGKTYHLTNAQIWNAVNKYVKEQEQKGTELTYYKQFVTLMNQLLDYVDE